MRAPTEKHLATDRRRIEHAATSTDPLAATGWLLCLFGAVLLPVLVARVGPFTVSDLSFASGALCLALAPRRNSPTRSQGLGVALLLAALGVLACSLGSSSLSGSLLVGLRLLYVFSIWQWCLRAAIDNEGRALALVRAFLVGATLSSLAAVAEIAGHIDIPGTLVVFGRASGLQGHPNGQGGVLAVALPMAIALSLLVKNRAFGLVVSAACVVGLILSGSVTGMIGATAGILVILLTGKRKILKVILLVVAGWLVWLLVNNLDRFFPGAASPLKRLADTTGNGVGDSTLQSRILTDQFAWAHITANPFNGVGLAGTDGATYDGRTLTHNLVLLAWYQGGILVAAAIIASVVIAFIAAVRLSRNRGIGIGLVLLSGVVSAVIFSMTGPVLYDRWFWFPLLIAISLYAREQSTSLNRELR